MELSKCKKNIFSLRRRFRHPNSYILKPFTAKNTNLVALHTSSPTERDSLVLLGPRLILHANWVDVLIVTPFNDLLEWQWRKRRSAKLLSAERVIVYTKIPFFAKKKNRRLLCLLTPVTVAWIAKIAANSDEAQHGAPLNGSRLWRVPLNRRWARNFRWKFVKFNKLEWRSQVGGYIELPSGVSRRFPNYSGSKKGKGLPEWAHATLKGMFILRSVDTEQFVTIGGLRFGAEIRMR